MENKINSVKGVGEEPSREESFLDMKSSNSQKDLDGKIEQEDSVDTETWEKQENEEPENDEDSSLDEENWWDTDEIWWRNDFDKSWSDRDPEISPKYDAGLYWPSDSQIFEKKEEPKEKISIHVPKEDLKVNQNCALRKFATQRLMGDICDVWNDDGHHGITANPMEDDIFLWKITILGPENSPFEGRLIQGVIQFTAEYPYASPTVMFTPTIFHPSVSESGDVCLNGILKHWTPCHSLLSFLTSVKYLLAEPSTLDPVNPIAAEFLEQNPIVYEEIARESALQHIPIKPTVPAMKTLEGFGLKSSNDGNENEKYLDEEIQIPDEDLEMFKGELSFEEIPEGEEEEKVLDEENPKEEESWFEKYTDNEIKNPHEKFWEEKEANEKIESSLELEEQENPEGEEKELTLTHM